MEGKFTISRIIVTLMNSLLIKCIFFPNGCDVRLSPNLIEAHQLECPLKVVLNKDCNH